MCQWNIGGAIYKTCYHAGGACNWGKPGKLQSVNWATIEVGGEEYRLWDHIWFKGISNGMADW